MIGKYISLMTYLVSKNILTFQKNIFTHKIFNDSNINQYQLSLWVRKK